MRVFTHALRCIVMTLVVLMPLSSTAQVPIDVWTTDDGLPQNSVTGLTQTHDGYLWFTTNEGLVRFDGARFKVFNRSNTPEITSNRMLGAFADRSGRIWMSTEEGDVLFHAAGRFHVVRTPDDLPAGMPSRFFDAPSGGVIFYVGRKTYSDKRHYEHLHHWNGKLVPLEIEGLAEDSYLVLTDKEGGLWFAGDGVLQRFKDGMMTSAHVGELGDGEFSRIAHEDHRGNVWVGHWGQRPLLLRIAADGRVDRFPMPQAHVSSFMEDARGNLWISLLDHGVYRVDRSAVAADAPVAPLLAPVALADRIPDFSMGHLCADREGGVWIGTIRGLVHLRPQSIRVFSKGDGLPEDNVYPVYEDRAGRIWAGIWQNTLVRYEDGRFHTFLRTADTFYITSLFEDRSGRFWIGTASDLYYLDDDELVRFTEQAGFAAIAEFSVITQDRDDALWFGTDQGLSRRAGGQVTLFTEKGGLPDDYITALLQASDGRIWVGTRRGLAAVASGHVTAFRTADGLASNHIRSLYEDSERVLWIGSYDGGLTRFKDGEFTALSVKDGLFSNGVFCILEDQRGWFWMNSNQGIFRVKKQQLNEIADGKGDALTSIAYDKRDGLLTVEGNGGRQPAGVAARDGKLWFPTARGIAMVDPEEVTTNPIPPPVLIEEVVVDGAAVAAEELQSALVEQSAIVLTPDQANLEITYTGISFLNAGHVKFRYKLEGQDRDWVDVGTRRTAYYSYLPPGAYTFRVIAANRDGVWNTRGASVALRVLPPFYATTWFITLSVAVLSCLAWAAYRGRVHRLRQQEKKLRRVVETIPATTWTALPDGSVDFISQQWREYTGPFVAQTVGSGLQSTIHPDDLAQYVERWRASLASGTLFECEARFRRGADREHRLFLARAVPLRDARGRILKWYGVLTDIEERKRAEAELERLRQLQADLAHTNRVSLLGELTASLAHEVNQPITATITNASASLRWLARDPPELDEARTAIKRIEQEARRTAEIVGRVKSFYKKGAPSRRESVDVNQVVGEMLVLLSREAHRLSVVMRTECALELPVVRADRVQLQQVLMNLMLNGIEAMEEGSGVLTIKTEEKDGHVLVAVSDDGVGLPVDRLDRIFDSFFTTKADGTGMGLSISRSIIEAHGGQLWASSNEGGGATFHFTIPAEPQPPATDVRRHEV